MKTTPDQAFINWWSEQAAFDTATPGVVAELAFIAGAKWAIEELHERAIDTIAETHLAGDSIPPTI